MSQAKCFNCGKALPIHISMQDLLKDTFPVFCGKECADLFPDNGTPEFNSNIVNLKVKFGV